MRLIKLGAAVLNQTPLDWGGNARRVREAIARARAEDVGLLCLPEMCLTGYGCEDAFLSPGVQRRAWALLQELAAETTGIAVSFGLPVLHRGKVYDCAALAVDGSLVGLAAKRDLAGDGVHYEPRWFRPWPRELRTVHRAADGSVVPIGDYVFDVGGVRVGFEICEEAWVARRPDGGAASGPQVPVQLPQTQRAGHLRTLQGGLPPPAVMEGGGGPPTPVPAHLAEATACHVANAAMRACGARRRAGARERNQQS